MKPGAELVITVWNLASDWAKEKARNGWIELSPHDFLIPWKNSQGKTEAKRYYHVFSRFELRQLLEITGFKIKKISFMNQGNWSGARKGKNLVVVAMKPKWSIK